MKVLLDNQIFESQKFGGISRYFQEISKKNDVINSIIPYVAPNLNLAKRIQRKIERNFFWKRKAHLTKNEYYNGLIAQSDFDVFHPTYYNNYFLESLKKPFVLTVYDMIHEKFAEYFGNSNDSIDKYTLCKRASKIIAISNSTKKDLIEIFDIPEHKIEVIYLGTNYHELPPSKPSIELKDRRYVLFTGNRSIYKNFLIFLQAIAPILKKNTDLILVCTGPSFDGVEEEWINNLTIKDKVISHFCKDDAELVYLYQYAECFVFPSLYEGFGIPILEAFACKCPVISSSGGSLKEIAGDAAIYFDPKNIKDLREAILRVLSDDLLRKQMVISGEQRLKDFSWDKCRKETNLVYEKVVDNI